MIFIILCKNDSQFEIKWRNLMQYLERRNAYNTRETDLRWGWKGYYVKGIHNRPTRFDELLDSEIEFDFQFMSPQDFVNWKKVATDDLEYCFIEDDLGLVFNFRFNFRMHDTMIRNSKKGYRLVLGDLRGYEIQTPDERTIIAQNREDNTMNIKIERVIFSNPATIVIWKDGTKTVAKCRKGDTYSKEAGLAICYMKKIMGSRKKFLKVMKKWIPEENSELSPLKKADDMAVEAMKRVKKAADMAVEAMKRGDLESAGKIAEDYKKNPREGISFDEYLNEQLKDPEFKKQYENTEIINEEKNDGNKTAL